MPCCHVVGVSRCRELRSLCPPASSLCFPPRERGSAPSTALSLSLRAHTPRSLRDTCGMSRDLVRRVRLALEGLQHAREVLRAVPRAHDGRPSKARVVALVVGWEGPYLLEGVLSEGQHVPRAARGRRCAGDRCVGESIGTQEAHAQDRVGGGGLEGGGEALTKGGDGGGGDGWVERSASETEGFGGRRNPSPQRLVRGVPQCVYILR